jgi:putative isomerase
MPAHPFYNFPNYAAQPGIAPAGKIVIKERDPEEAQQIVNEFILKNWKKTARSPRGELAHPYLVPGATYDDLWDWDAFFTGCVIPEEGLPYASGSCLDLLDAPLKDGRPSKKASVSGNYEYTQHPYPLRAQFAAVMLKRGALNENALAPRWEILERTLLWYEEKCRDKEGFFIWQTYSGIDNDPSVYGRKRGTAAGVDLACFMYREYCAMSLIARKLKAEDGYAQKAEDLKLLIQTRYFDTKDNRFYALDRDIDFNMPGRQHITWNTYLRFDSSSNLYPLWAKAATSNQAALLRDMIMDEKQFLSPAGIRSHSKADVQIYNNEIMGGPFNWQGPVWGLSTVLNVYGLLSYGYKDEAGEAAKRLLNTFAADIEQNGCLHEYYNGDTGQPLLKPGFLNWNLMAFDLLKNISENFVPTDF